MKPSLVDEFTDMFNKIGKTQGENFDGKCSCKECYWNMWSPNRKNFSDENSMQCVSESLADFKMTPNSLECKGYWSFEEACGHKKGGN